MAGLVSDCEMAVRTDEQKGGSVSEPGCLENFCAFRPCGPSAWQPEGRGARGRHMLSVFCEREVPAK